MPIRSTWMDNCCRFRIMCRLTAHDRTQTNDIARPRKPAMRFFPATRRSRCGIALRKQARMRLHIQVRIAATMPGIVDLLARHQIGRHGLGRRLPCGGSAGIGARRRATGEERNEQDGDQRRTKDGTIHFAGRNESLIGAARFQYCRSERYESRRKNRPSIAFLPIDSPLTDFMFRSALIAPMTRT